MTVPVYLKRRSRRVVAMAVALAITIAGAGAHENASKGGPVDPFEPTVTKAESKLLAETMDVALTNMPAAINMLEKNELDHPGAAIFFALGNLYFQQDELDTAAEAYREALEHMPHFRSAMMNLGRVYLLQEKTDDAIALYQELVADGQANADILLLLGHALLIEANPVSAESAYRQSLLLRPKEPEAMTGLAKTLISQARYAEGLALVGEILQDDIQNRELWAIQINALLSMGRNDEATVSMEQARRLGSADAEMLASLGDMYLNREQPEEAIAVYEEAFAEEEPSVKRMFRAARGFIMLGDTERAEQMLTSIQNIFTENKQSLDTEQKLMMLRLEGTLARYQGKSTDAKKIYEKILQIDPLDGETMLLLGDLLRTEGMEEDALIRYEQAARIKGFEADALIRQAQVEVARERYKRAVELLERAQVFKKQNHVERFLTQIRRMVKRF